MTTPARREVPWALGILIFIALLNLLGIGLQIVVLNPAAQANRNDISALVAKQHTSDLEFCARSNAARVSLVHNLRGDVHSLKAELALWVAAAAATTPEAAAATPPSVSKAFTDDVAAIELAIRRKKHAIHTAIKAQSSVAIHHGSPVVDCHLAYP